jgi:uncharacterized protein YdaU (DUF1376 family)
MTRADTWMPLYIGDYLRDTGHLTTEEHGAYMLLIMQGWTREGLLPLDNDRLRMLARLDVKSWKRSKDTLLAFFTATPDGFRHKRVDRELSNTQAVVEQRRAAGKASAEARARLRAPVHPSNGGPTEQGGNDNADGNETGNGNPTTVGTKQSTADLRNGRPSQPQPQEGSKLGASEGRTPRWNDTEVVWEAFTGQAEICEDAQRRATYRGVYIRGAGTDVLDAARINDVSWRGDFRPLIAWLDEGIEFTRILAAVKRVAGRPGYKPPASLKFFDGAVREQRA